MAYSYSKPEDGQITVSKILIHPIKVQFTVLYMCDLVPGVQCTCTNGVWWMFTIMPLASWVLRDAFSMMALLFCFVLMIYQDYRFVDP